MLFGHPAVHQAAVFGLPNRVMGELVGAAVTLRPEAQVSTPAREPTRSTGAGWAGLLRGPAAGAGSAPRAGRRRRVQRRALARARWPAQGKSRPPHRDRTPCPALPALPRRPPRHAS